MCLEITEQSNIYHSVKPGGKSSGQKERKEAELLSSQPSSQSIKAKGHLLQKQDEVPIIVALKMLCLRARVIFRT